MKARYTPLKIFHYKEKLDSLPLSERRILAPLHIRMKPTNRCNHNCSYCAYRVENLQLGKDMRIGDSIPFEKMTEILNDLIEMGVKSLTFSGGGEPLLYPHIEETVKILAESPISFAALTNGALLQGSIANRFAESGTWIRVSMDGWDDDSYTKYRGVRDGEYTKIIKNMEAFKKHNGKCLLGVSLIIDKNNYSKIYEQVQCLKSIGVDNVKISPCISSNDGAANNAYHKPFFDSAKAEAERSKKDLEDDSFEVFDSYHHLDEKFVKNYTWCPYQQILAVIGADLNVYPCQDKAYNLDNGLLGSISDCNFKDFWFKEKSTHFKINPSKDCNHHCVANMKNQLVLDYFNCDLEHLAFV